MATMLALFALILLVPVLAWHSHLVGALKWRPPIRRIGRYPSVTIVRPIKGMDAGVRENARAGLDIAYPGEVETLFVFDDETEPALPAVRRAVANQRRSRQPGKARILFCGSPPTGRTGKLHAMIAALRHSHNELVAFVDSDVRLDLDALTVLVDTLLWAPHTGAAFAPVVVADQPQTVGDVGFALIQNSLYGPEVAAATRHNKGELPFIMGKFMVLRREAIEAIGGLEVADGQLVDDMYLGMKLAEVGFRNAVAPHRVQIIQYGMSLDEFAQVFTRWYAFSRTGLAGWAFKLPMVVRGIVFLTVLVILVASITLGYGLAVAAAATTVLAIALSMLRLHHASGGAPLSWLWLWAPIALLLGGVAVALQLHLRREVTWRGRTYQLDASSRLAPARRHSHVHDPLFDSGSSWF